MARLLPDLLGRFAFAGGGPGFVGGDADRRYGSAIHAAEGDQFPVGVGDRNDGGFFHLQGAFHNCGNNLLGLSIFDGVKGFHRIFLVEL